MCKVKLRLANKYRTIVSVKAKWWRDVLYSFGKKNCLHSFIFNKRKNKKLFKRFTSNIGGARFSTPETKRINNV